jgi:hypothetical protein
VDEVDCISVNDAFVMYQWGRHLGVEKVKLLPDGSGDFTRRMGMLIRKDHLGFGERSWRYAMVVDDGEIVGWWRPRAKGRTLHLEIERWQRRSVTDDAIGEQAERLAEHRGLTLGTISAPS